MSSWATPGKKEPDHQHSHRWNVQRLSCGVPYGQPDGRGRQQRHDDPDHQRVGPRPLSQTWRQVRNWRCIQRLHCRCDRRAVRLPAQGGVGGSDSHVSTGHGGYQQYFTVLQDITDSSGTIAALVYPAITPSGQYQNVTQAAVLNAIITMVGTTGIVAPAGLADAP